LNTTNPPNPPNNKWIKGNNKSQGQGDNPNNQIHEQGATKTRSTKMPKGEIKMDNHDKEGIITFESTSHVHYVVSMAITPIISPK
jgi:hypothetical protein